MKRITLILSSIALLIIIGSEIVQAQGHFSVEVMGNPADAMVAGDQYIYESSSDPNNPVYSTLGKKFTFGMAEGIAVSYRIKERTGISVGIMYSHQGQDYAAFHQSFPGSNTSSDFDYSVSLNYLKAPVLFHYTMPWHNKLSFSFYGGFYVGFLLNYQIQATTVDHNIAFTDQYGNTIGYGDFTDVTTTSGISMTDQGSITPYTVAHTDNTSLSAKVFNTVDAGAMIGAGIEFKLTDKFSIPCMLNYSLGFTDIKNHNASIYDDLYLRYGFDAPAYWGSGPDPNGSSKLYNSALGLSVGLKMNL